MTPVTASSHHPPAGEPCLRPPAGCPEADRIKRSHAPVANCGRQRKGQSNSPVGLPQLTEIHVASLDLRVRRCNKQSSERRSDHHETDEGITDPQCGRRAGKAAIRSDDVSFLLSVREGGSLLCGGMHIAPIVDKPRLASLPDVVSAQPAQRHDVGRRFT
jgi:hypothetical protein